MELLFSVNEYDKDGDLMEECVCLHIDATTIIKFKSGDDLKEFADRILGMLPEIREGHPEAFGESA